jgi:hypothetical protein
MNKKNSKTTLIVFLSAFSILVLNGLILYAFADKNVAKDKISSIIEENSIDLGNVSTAHILKTEPKEISPKALDESFSAEITDEELQIYTNYISNIKGVKQNSNRDLSESEQSRKLLLSDQYLYDDIRPESIISTSGSTSDLYIDIDNDFLHYPNRELTDEELLQIIDFNKKINYVLSLGDVKASPSIKDINEDEAATKAIESVEKLFGIDTSKLEVTVGYLGSGPINNLYLVRMAPYRRDYLRANEETFWEYAIFIDTLTGDVIQTKSWCSIYDFPPIEKDKIQDIIEAEDWTNIAEDIIANKQRDKRDIVSSEVIFEDSEGSRSHRRLSENGYIDVQVELEDGSYYVVTLYYPDKSLRELNYTKNK